MENDYYSLLGINSNSTFNEIKKAFRKMSLDYHPDRNKNDIEKTHIFKKINQAYEILSDPNKRKTYDESIKMFNIGNLNNIENILKSEIFSSLFSNLN